MRGNSHVIVICYAPMCRAVEFESYARQQSRDRYLENDCLYKCVFKWDLKQATVLNIKSSITSGGRLFQISGAAHLKARLVNAVLTPSGTAKRWRADGRRTRAGSCHCKLYCFNKISAYFKCVNVDLFIIGKKCCYDRIFFLKIP